MIVICLLILHVLPARQYCRALDDLIARIPVPGGGGEERASLSRGEGGGGRRAGDAPVGRRQRCAEHHHRGGARWRPNNVAPIIIVCRMSFRGRSRPLPPPPPWSCHRLTGGAGGLPHHVTEIAANTPNSGDHATVRGGRAVPARSTRRPLPSVPEARNPGPCQQRPLRPTRRHDPSTNCLRRAYSDGPGRLAMS